MPVQRKGEEEWGTGSESWKSFFMASSSLGSLQVGVSEEGQEVGELRAGDQLPKKLRGKFKTSGIETLSTQLLADLFQFLGDEGSHHGHVHLAAILQHAARVTDPLPHLSAGDLRGCRILHQVIERNAAHAA